MTKMIFLVLDEHNIVVDVSETETPHIYCEVEDDVDIESIREFLELEKYVIKYDNDCLIIVEEKIVIDHDTHIEPPPDKVQQLIDEVAVLKQQVQDLQTAVDNLTVLLEHEVEIDTGGDV